MINFAFNAETDDRKRLNGYGSVCLYLSGHPIWFGGSESSPELISWTWIEFLHHIAKTWHLLVSEAVYPLDWMRECPGDVWRRADSRWLNNERLADIEESLVREFQSAHNLAAGFCGINLPAIIWIRSGDGVRLYPEGSEPVQIGAAEAIQCLESFCDKLAAAFVDSENHLARHAMQLWNSRNKLSTFIL